MSDSENWRIGQDAKDYFLHTQKKLDLADRRPVIRNSLDLVGPGIGALAVRIEDYNALLVTFNGYYSSAPGAANAPNTTDPFVGYVISDGELGGIHVFTSLLSGDEYRRVFVRSPGDSEVISWGAWG